MSRHISLRRRFWRWVYRWQYRIEQKLYDWFNYDPYE